MLHAIVFLTSAVTMSFELVGARILAPYLGTSIEVWAGLIATILGGMSLGYFLGGKIADKRPNYTILAGIIFLSGIAIILSWAFRDIVPITFVSLAKGSLTFISISAGLFLFVPATTFLGMVTPFAAKLSLTRLDNSARTVGGLSAAGTIGSLLGTVVTSAWLIPSYGTSTLLISLSLGLILLSFLITIRWRFIGRVALGLVVFTVAASIGAQAANLSPNRIADIDTLYNRIWIEDHYSEDKTIGIRTLRTDPYGIQCASFIDEAKNLRKELVFDYTKSFDLAFHFVPKPQKILMIGGCNYSYPRHILELFPGAIIDVVEIDPGMTEVARKYFGFIDNPRMRIIEEDARTFLNRNETKYDVIFVDAFNSHSAVPYQLTTREAMQKLSGSMTDTGVATLNLIGSFSGPTSKLFEAQYATLDSVFPSLYFFQVLPIPLNSTQNILAIVSKNSLDKKFTSENVVTARQLSFQVLGDKLRKGIILTDDYAPVERLGAPIRESVIRDRKN